jgi:hypothetical protein
MKTMEISRFEYIRNYDKYLPDMMKNEMAYNYMHQVYDYLELMETGTTISLHEDTQKLPWLLVACGAFMAASDHWIDFELNDDYTKLRRRFVPPNFRKLMIKQSI